MISDVVLQLDPGFTLQAESGSSYQILPFTAVLQNAYPGIFTFDVATSSSCVGSTATVHNFVNWQKVGSKLVSDAPQVSVPGLVQFVTEGEIAVQVIVYSDNPPVTIGARWNQRSMVGFNSATEPFVSSTSTSYASPTVLSFSHHAYVGDTLIAAVLPSELSNTSTTTLSQSSMYLTYSISMSHLLPCC